MVGEGGVNDVIVVSGEGVNVTVVSGEGVNVITLSLSRSTST